MGYDLNFYEQSCITAANQVQDLSQLSDEEDRAFMDLLLDTYEDSESEMESVYPYENASVPAMVKSQLNTYGNCCSFALQFLFGLVFTGLLQKKVTFHFLGLYWLMFVQGKFYEG